MRTPYTVSLYNSIGQKDENGNWIESLEYIKELYCDIQPYSQELLLKHYGYNIECSKRIFCGCDKDIKIGSIFKYTDKLGNTKTYEVKVIIDWDYYFKDLAVLEVV